MTPARWRSRTTGRSRPRRSDVLDIGYQNRPRLFELAIRKSEPLHRDVLEIDERIAADGTVLREPDPVAVRRGLASLRERGVEAVAICLLNAYRNGRHEERRGTVWADEVPEGDPGRRG